MTVQFREQEHVAIIGDTTPLRRGVFIGYIGSRLRAAVLLENGNLEQVAIGDLIPHDQIASEERRIQSEQSRLKREFEDVRLEIAEQMEIAAQALRKASELARTQNEDLVSGEFYREVRPFLSAFDDAGWSSSSLNC